MVHTNEIPDPARAAAHRRAIWSALLAELRVNGSELLPGVRDRAALAKHVASVERVLESMATGATLQDALALHPDEDDDDGAEQQLPLTREDILELHYLATEVRQSHANTLDVIRTGRPQILARCADRGKMERQLDELEAGQIEGERAASEELAMYDRLLAQCLPPDEGEAPGA